MPNFVMLDNNKHAGLKVRHDYTPESGASVNQVRVFVTEFEELHKEYPIFFRKTEEGAYYAVSILGLDTDENLFLDAPRWNARYVPAAMQRGPFKIGLTQTPSDGSVAMINIDLDDKRVGPEEGIALFEPNGGLSPYLNQISKVLNLIHVGLEKEPEFFDILEKLSLIEPLTVQLKVSEDKGYTIPEIFTVSREGLLALSEKDLMSIHQSGLLALCHAVLSSTSNANHLLEMKLRHGQA